MSSIRTGPTGRRPGGPTSGRSPPRPISWRGRASAPTSKSDGVPRQGGADPARRVAHQDRFAHAGAEEAAELRIHQGPADPPLDDVAHRARPEAAVPALAHEPPA